jgi:hypothetical protein
MSKKSKRKPTKSSVDYKSSSYIANLYIDSSSRLVAGAKKMRQLNMGSVKYNANETSARASIDCEVNAAFNELYRTKRPSILVVEDLRHAFTFNKPKGIN